MQHYNERPMMLNAWTQTSDGDLGISRDYQNNVNMEVQRQKESALLEKIRVLEENLRAHTEILLNMQKSNGRRSITKMSKQQKLQPDQSGGTSAPILLYQAHQPQQQTEHQSQLQFQMHQEQQGPHNQKSFAQMTQEQSEQYKQQLETREQQFLFEEQQADENILPTKQHSVGSHNSPTVINNVQQVPIGSVNYTIIADGNNDVPGEPIEIQIAEEDNALNLNCSADSERLEICIADEQEAERNVSFVKSANDIAEESTQNLQPQQNQQRIRLTSTNTVKRRRLSQNTSNSKAQCSVPQGYIGTALPKAISATVPTAESTPLLPLHTNCNNGSLLKKQAGPLFIDGNHSTPLSPKMDLDNVLVSIGPNNTRISVKDYEAVNWTTPSVATRKLLTAIFDRETMATHSMTGRPSPAFKGLNKPKKAQLDPLVVQDIIFAVTRRCKVTDKEVRTAITTKCADENKMWKMDQAKNKENVGQVKDEFLDEVS